jgi:hypothetical protein
MKYSILRGAASLIFIWMVITLTGCGGGQHPGRDGKSNVLGAGSWPRPALLTTPAQQTTPGLSVVYAHCKIRHLDEMPSRKWMAEKGEPGEPIRMIAHQFGNGEVFGSGKKRLVCVQMQGYLKFEKSGRYLMKANSNDGIRVFLDNKMILNDPDGHADRFTSETEIEIKEPGRYVILMRYFQRKGTAALEMYWKTPGADKFDIIPAMAYSHDSNAS